jgi:hypothetical protein
MASVYGKIKSKNMREIIDWIKNKVLECIFGKGRRYIKDNFETISEMDMVNFII